VRRGSRTESRIYGYARRIERLRAFYLDHAPEVRAYVVQAPIDERFLVHGLLGGRWQGFRTVAGMVAVLSAGMAGSASGLLVALAFGHSLVATLAVGGLVFAAIAWVLMSYQRGAWERASTISLDMENPEANRRD
jgi:hypothetical protein